MSKKIGILTTYFASNFGAMLQPFALKRVLEQFGYEVEMIRYRQPQVAQYYSPYKFRQMARQMVSRKMFHAIEYFIYGFHMLLKKDSVFKQYMLKHINSEEGYEKNWPKDKDLYFIGSDQLWSSKNMGGFDDVYFGAFQTQPNAKKIAYAISAEVLEYNQDEIDYFNKKLANFDMISVREQTLAENLIKYTNHKNIEVTIDPTMLAEPNIFNEIQHINPCPEKKFVLFYQIRSCFHFTSKIYQYARSIEADLVIFSEQPDIRFAIYEWRHRHVHYLPSAGEEIFLGAMQNAECVFTPSFHGCVFSIINHTPLFDLLLDDGRDTRGINLLKSLGLEHRFLRFEDEIRDTKIDYEKVDSKLTSLRNCSMNFVKRALSL